MNYDPKDWLVILSGVFGCSPLISAVFSTTPMYLKNQAWFPAGVAAKRTCIPTLG
jgi:hypothetical protein